MDAEWFAARMELMGLRQEDIGKALGMDRSTVSRIQSGARPLTLAEVEPLAKILQVPPIEIIDRAHKWRSPIRSQTEIRSDWLEIALELALQVAHEAAVAHHAAVIYGLLQDSEASGIPITTDKEVQRLIVDTIRRILRAQLPSSTKH